FPIMSPSRNAQATATFLSTHLNRVPAYQAPAPMTGADAAFTTTKYRIPGWGDLPHDLMPDSQGRIVITGMMTQQMYVLDPATGTYSTVPTPANGARALDIGPDGTWYVALGQGNQVAAYDPRTQQWRSWGIGMYPHDVVRDPKGRIWFNGHFTKNPELLGVLDPATGSIRTFEVPVPAMPDGGSNIPYGMRVGADGTVWMTELRGNRLVKFNPDTERFTLYTMPTEMSGPRRPAFAPDGSLWIPEYAANKIARFDPVSERFQEWTLPIADALPYIVRVAPTGHVWVATSGADAVLRFNPADGTWLVHRLPTPKALIRHMELDPSSEGVWVAYGNSPAIDPKVVRIVPRRTGSVGVSPSPRTGFGMRLQAYPNPSSGTVRVALQVEQTARVRVAVYDRLGRLVRTLHSGTVVPGARGLEWDGRSEGSEKAAPGVYLIRIEDGCNSRTVPITVVS
ncbi:MAG TPA: FlgD immunoglobulin-like domain containing protein, partial [Rhodothermales bacterium]|nr:FlgD immunoglobulin-like domain containing protein [Rhodothermales bacterium]